MTTQHTSPGTTSPAASPDGGVPGAIGGLHHVGHVVRDMDAAIGHYRRLGFVVPPPSYPALPPREGASPRPFGAGNTHVEFSRNFMELATVVDGDVGGDATLVPLHAPPEVLPRLTETIERTAARLAVALARFEGLHILVFQTPDADAAAARLAADGVAHSGVNRMQRPVETERGTQLVPIGHLEIDGDPDATPEGRLAVAEELPAAFRAQQRFDHPNGAVDLVGSVLCVPAAELVEYERRYATYLGRPARSDGQARVFDLEGSQITLVADTDLGSVLPGEQAPALPAFVAYAVAVRDLAAARSLLEGNGYPVRETGAGDLFVPAAAALGAAVIFRPAS